MPNTIAIDLEFGVLHNDSLQMIETASGLTDSLGLLHLNDMKTVIPYDTMTRILDEKDEQIATLSSLMNPRTRSKSNQIGKNAVSDRIRKLINNSPGAMCTLKVHETKRVRDSSGRRIKQSSYRNQYAPKPGLVTMVGKNPLLERVMNDLPPTQTQVQTYCLNLNLS